MMHFIRISLRNLKRNFKRNIATGSAIVLGFVGIMMLGGYANRVANFLRVHTVYISHTGHIAIYPVEGLLKASHKPKKYSLSPDDQKNIESALAADANVDFFERQLQGTGLVGNGCQSLPFIASGIDPEVDRQVRSHAEVNEWLSDIKFFTKGRGIWNYSPDVGAVALAGGLVRALGKKHIHDEIPKQTALTMVNCDAPDAKEQFARDANIQLLSGSWQGSMSALDGEVVAHFTTGFDEADNAAIMMSTAHLQRLFETDHIGRYAVWLKDASLLDKSMKKLQEQLVVSGRKYEMIKWNEERLSPFYAGTTQFVYILNIFIGIVLAVVITLSVLNSTTMTIIERSQEIGMYRAFGFKRRQVRSLFILESLWLSLVSLIVGYLLGSLVIFLINAAGIIYHPPGASGGMALKLAVKNSYVLWSALIILGLTLMATWGGVATRVRFVISDLLGSANR